MRDGIAGIVKNYAKNTFFGTLIYDLSFWDGEFVAYGLFLSYGTKWHQRKDLRFLHPRHRSLGRGWQFAAVMHTDGRPVILNDAAALPMRPERGPIDSGLAT